MKRSIAYAGAIALGLSGLVVAPSFVAAQSGGNSPAAKACNSGLADALGVSVGTCIALYVDGDAHAVCKALDDLNLLSLVGARNQGECIIILG